ncbi:MAG: hypothetical protein JXR83_08535 [Deltaproteobacteria bacterium]|nr:hypothetical protein [Deltaproteobacteria bacterium]
MLSPDKIDVFARGLYHVAAIDGVDPKETELIQSFLKEAGQPELAKTLPRSSFHVSELAALETTFLKRTFLKACLVLIRGDGKITQAEKMLVMQLALNLGLEDEFDALDQEAAKESFK